ncbi:MAG TPA: acetyl-CoA carboxylase biotin carboxyl carrier protein subunit [Dehalococcoidia bacterium]|nr:acetyl-CoA carboxylase biotin carboxyl carrier protein subunit [Dehalococcoidia bacterium]
MAQERIEAPIPGKIVSVAVTVGCSITEDGEICVLQSMKMQNPILSPVEGTVVEVKVAPGETIETGALIAIIEC